MNKAFITMQCYCELWFSSLRNWLFCTSEFLQFLWNRLRCTVYGCVIKDIHILDSIFWLVLHSIDAHLQTFLISYCTSPNVIVFCFKKKFVIYAIAHKSYVIKNWIFDKICLSAQRHSLVFWNNCAADAQLLAKK